MEGGKKRGKGERDEKGGVLRKEEGHNEKTAL